MVELGLWSPCSWTEIVSHQAVWPWANHITSLDSVSSSVKMELTSSQGCIKYIIQWHLEYSLEKIKHQSALTTSYMGQRKVSDQYSWTLMIYLGREILKSIPIIILQLPRFLHLFEYYSYTLLALRKVRQ